MLKMLDAPSNFIFSYIIGLIMCCGYGSYCSNSTIWKSWFPTDKSGNLLEGTYLKAGEYGESEIKATWSVFFEPLNAWTSLTYSLFGVVILLTGLCDLFTTSLEILPPNRLCESPYFSIIYGLSSIFLGISSFMFHASHAESWRKADAGMTSGCVVAPLVFGLWDRARPPGIGPITMACLAVLLQLSFTHGYLPYGSSDILLPSLVAMCWILELLPRYGGAVHPGQYKYWLHCFLCAGGGMLLRLADIKRKSPAFSTNSLRLFFAICVFPFGYFLGYDDAVLIAAFLAGVVVRHNPSRGHIFWHFGSAYALYIWWYQARVRPGDTLFPYGADRTLLGLVFFVVIKNAIRRLIMTTTFVSSELKDRLFILLEHSVFVIWGVMVLLVFPGHPNASWLLHPSLCWTYPIYPFEAFHLYYMVKVATHVEDLGYAAVSYVISRTADKEQQAQVLHHNSPTAQHDMKMNIHHIATALLCVCSYATGYVKIGSLIMFLHDISDLPLDCMRIFTILHWKKWQIASYIATVFMWLYWRLWFFPTSVMYTIAVEARSLIFTDNSCAVGQCSWQQVPERVPFLLLLGALQVLHVIWFGMMLKKGYKELVQG